jgi:hypothetical protein
MSKTGRERWGGITHYAIDSHDFTENDAGGGVGGARLARISSKQHPSRPDEILGPYTGSPNTTANDGRASDEDSPEMSKQRIMCAIQRCEL